MHLSYLIDDVDRQFSSLVGNEERIAAYTQTQVS